METAGSVDERGLMNNLFKKGFTPQSCISELIGNCIDSGATECILLNMNDKLLIMDNGKGMDNTCIKSMFAIYKENHKEDHSIGTCGLGAKAAIMILCQKKSQAYVYSKQDSKLFYKAYIPVGDIFSQCKYYDMVKIGPMDQNEIKQYEKLRQNVGLSTQGTTIVLPYSSDMEDVILNNLERYENEFSQKIGLVYAKFPTKIKFIDHEMNVSEFRKYKYFSLDPEVQYYCKKFKYPIYVLQHPVSQALRFVMHHEGKYLEILKHGRGYKKSPEEINFTNLQNSILGKFTVLIGQRKDDNYFDEDDPVMPTDVEKGKRAAKSLTEYDAEFFDPESNYLDFLSKPFLVRNNQVIGSFDIGQKVSSARGDAKQMHKIFHVRMEMSYSTDSSQTNLMDEISGIQENKNQHKNNLHVPLVRLLEFAKDYVHGKIWEHFQNVCANKEEEESEPEPDDDDDDYDEPVRSKPSKNKDEIQPVRNIPSKEKEEKKNQDLKNASENVLPPKPMYYTKSGVFQLFQINGVGLSENKEHKVYLMHIIQDQMKIKDQKIAAQMLSIVPNKVLVDMIYEGWREKEENESVLPVVSLEGIEKTENPGSTFSLRGIFGL